MVVGIHHRVEGDSEVLIRSRDAAEFHSRDEGVIDVGWEDSQPLAGVFALVKDAFDEG